MNTFYSNIVSSKNGTISIKNPYYCLPTEGASQILIYLGFYFKKDITREDGSLYNWLGLKDTEENRKKVNKVVYIIEKNIKKQQEKAEKFVNDIVDEYMHIYYEY